MGKENRRSTRVNPPIGSVIINQMNDENLGSVVNISATGFLLASRRKVEEGQIFQVSLIIPHVELHKVSIGVECLWSESQKSGLIFGGFHIIDISEHDEQAMKKIIQQLIVG